MQALAFGASDSSTSEVNVKQFMNLAIGSSGVQLPNILSVNTNYLLELDRRCRVT